MLNATGFSFLHAAFVEILPCSGCRRTRHCPECQYYLLSVVVPSRSHSEPGKLSGHPLAPVPFKLSGPLPLFRDIGDVKKQMRMIKLSLNLLRRLRLDRAINLFLIEGCL